MEVDHPVHLPIVDGDQYAIGDEVHAVDARGLLNHEILDYFLHAHGGLDQPVYMNLLAPAHAHVVLSVPVCDCLLTAPILVLAYFAVRQLARGHAIGSLDRAHYLDRGFEGYQHDLVEGSQGQDLSAAFYPAVLDVVVHVVGFIEQQLVLDTRPQVVLYAVHVDVPLRVTGHKILEVLRAEQHLQDSILL